MELRNSDVDIIYSSLMTLEGTIIKLGVNFESTCLKKGTSDCSLVREKIRDRRELSSASIRH